jgi:hypothetical protein
MMQTQRRMAGVYGQVPATLREAVPVGPGQCAEPGRTRDAQGMN